MTERKKMDLAKLKIGFRKKNNEKENEDILTRNSTLRTSEGENLNIEEYLYLDLEEGIEKIKKGIPEENDMEESSLWQIAEKNMEDDYVLSDLGRLLGSQSVNRMIILSNKKRFLGASALLSFQAREKICRELGTTKFLVLPSSIHEVIIVNKIDKEIDELNDLVKFVNETQVIPEERLEDKAFFVELYS